MRLRRLFTICHTAARYRLDTLLDQDGMPLWLRLLLRIGPWRLVPVGERSRGERLRLALESLGPIFIKFGQLLSTRRDLLPPDIADELARLQDQVPPFPGKTAVAIIEKSLGAPVAALFAEFSTTPLASASVAQVHVATLNTGEDVVVKVIRPGIESIIRQDIDLLYALARFLRRYVPDGRRLRPVEVVEGYEHTIFDELDLQREGANTTQLKRNFAGSDQLYIPAVYWDYTSRNVLTLERIRGVPVTDLAALEAAGTDMKALAEMGVEIFFAQVFRDNFFHADMHPGNIFVDVTDPARPSYIGIDCAIIGSLTESDQYYIARNLLAMFRRNYREVAELHLESGWITPETKVHEFEAAIRSACEPIFEKPLGEISFAQLLIYLFQTARRFDMEVQPSLVLLQKTLINIEGLGRQLYPQLDLWHTAYPYLEHWLYERYSPTNMARKLWRRLPGWLEHLPKVPDQIFRQLERAGELERRALDQEQQLARLERQFQRERRRSRALLLAATAVLGAMLVPLIGTGWQELPPASWLLLGIAAAALLR